MLASPIVFLLGLSSFASYSPLQTAVPFYRSAQSAFVSGQASRSRLEERILRSELEVQFQTRWDNKNYLLKGETFLRDIQLAKEVTTRSGAQLLAEKKSTAFVLETLPAAEPLQILECDEYWAKVLRLKNKSQGFIPLHLLQARSEDKGYYINVVDTYLRATNKDGAEIITTIPRLTRLEAVSFSKAWMRVRYQNYTGFVDLNHFVSRADFANLVYHPRKHWVTVTHRENNFMITPDKDRIPLSDIWGFLTNPSRAIVIDNSLKANTPPFQARVEILKPDVRLWSVSLLEGHGEVWWKKTADLEISATATDEITTEQLMKRKIFSVSFAGRNSLRGLVSADGIFRSEDGLVWKKIPQFFSQNYPVSIHPDGTWFVGSFKSLDQGKQFDPFIRWDHLAQAIESAIHRSPKILKLTRIDSLPHSRVQIQVDTGSQNIKLRSSLLGDTWEVIKN